ncbi:MAG: type VI secretion system tip protein TssI/VgrG [Pirellulaceae bacterium]
MATADTIHEIICAKGAFELRRITIHEELGRPFHFEIEAYSNFHDPATGSAAEVSDYPPYDYLGKPICVRIKRPAGVERFFHGLVSRFLNVGRFGNYQVYHFVVRPWLWFLSHTADCRIFQNKKVTDIIQEVFRDNGFSDFKLSLQATYREWEYCVQYRESDFAFVSRLMEQEGIYYYFEHEKAKHTLVMIDAPAAHKPIAGTSKLVYRPPGEAQVGVEHISRWRRAFEVQTGAVVLDDFDFTKPKAALEGKSAVKHKHAHADLEVFDYPGEFTEKTDSSLYAKTRIQELQVKHSQVEAVGDAQGLTAGGKFTLAEFPRNDQNGDYLVVAATIEIESGELEQFGAAENKFEATVTAIDASQQFRPPRITPAPRAHGPQTAIVVGKRGEEIWTEQHGRVKVQFHWDRYGKVDENSSCWLRVAQMWAGQNWGAIHIPRIGQEVIVEFLEGDLDRPIITGRVYNADQPPPYKLPDNQTQSGLLTRTTKEGNPKLANELRFEDKKDQEEIYFHAERDFNRVVENNDTLKVGFEHKDKGDQTIEIHNNQQLTVGNSKSDDGSQTITIWKNRTETVKEGNESVTVEKGNRTVTLDTGNDTHQIKKGNRDVQIDLGNDTLTIKAGNQTVKLNVGKSTLDAMQGIELKSGPSSIKIEPSGITIKGPMVTIEGQAKADLKAPITSVAGTGMLQMQGGLVKIN